MQRFSFLFIFVFSSLSYAKHDIRVLIDQQKKGIEFYSEFPVHLKTINDKAKVSFPKATYKINKHGSRWFISVQTLNHKQQYSLRGRKLTISTLSMEINKETVKFPITLTRARGKYQIIGNMDIEDYLAGVLPHEMPASWPVEALKAQAVASRSYAFWKSQEQRNNDYDLQSTIHDQVFKLNRPSSSLKHVRDALESTKDQILLNGKNKIVKAYFHSDCGGVTDSSESVWGRSDSKAGSVRDVACSNRKRNEWASFFSEKQILDKLKKELMIPTSLGLVNILVRKKLKSQRVEWVDILFTKGILKRLRGEDIRRLLGYSNIRSTLFKVTKNNRGWKFAGKGFGHGVGLCQWGTKSMASTGKSYKEILKHYYPSTKLGTFDESQGVLVSFLDH